jgi:polysaccharide export outer membrane protein
MLNQNVTTYWRFGAGAGRGRRVAGLLLLACASLAACVSLAGCVGSRGGPIPYDVKNFKQPDSQTIVTASADYKIAPMDTLHITVFQVPDLSGDFDVDLMGNVSLPLVGEVKAADLTTNELDKLITARLGEKYLQNPEVNVGLKASARRNVTLDGSVAQPGMYPVNGPTTLIQAVALARGTSTDANPHRVAIFRQVDGKRMAAAFDLVSIRRGEMEDPQVYSGDIIVVDGSRIKAIQNQILMALPVIGAFNPVVF